ncbi:riboflavin synthase, alpha subunit [Deferribacter desulfuricans SSM1]|uniref:Riboflavin synthase n=1 Tax=Deferribacter desulfuricans (strain DSM 14783 / JCM 11476 / NBRC 101012 / SSM1) TaxID=639282 RepID=D3PD93_DEFDS|nr:riboflavin synthase [Deferribacter desulfuricans]BAI80566.1 riboflavin synthase, alpha subunit [Deferribacter desulfuricans SSM1]
MFTGIVEETGKVVFFQKKSDFAKIKIKCDTVLEKTQVGDSIAVNGVCLTVVDLDENSFSADISYESIERSTFKYCTTGWAVNLERALTLEKRLGGHLVQGHVDGIGKIVKIMEYKDAYKLQILYPSELDKYIAVKGSITIDGISLTVASEIAANTIEVAVIPHTFMVTNLKDKKSGDYVNIEVDVIARYLEKLLKKEKDTSKLYEDIQNLMSLEDY